MHTPKLYLASQSPRRGELLHQMDIDFERLSVDVDEMPAIEEEAAGYVRRLARAKASAGWTRVMEDNLPNLPVLGADTAVVVDGRILGKPMNREDGLAMLASLAGRCHRVMSAVCLLAGDFQREALSVTEVCFRPLSSEECQRYWDTGEPADKAGAYAIQGRAAAFVEVLHGSYSGVVGLPLFETCAMLEEYWHRR